MRAVVCRVKETTLTVDDKLISQINQGLIVYLGIHQSDTEDIIDKLATKITKLRIFEDEDEKMNLRLDPKKHQLLIVSQFTLYGDVTNHNRPSFSQAAKPAVAEPLYERLVDHLKAFGFDVKTGVFGAHMMINSLYDGPVNLLIEMGNAS